MKQKLTLVSFWARGRRLSKFMRLPLNEKGQPVLPESEVHKFIRELGVSFRGATFSIGI